MSDVSAILQQLAENAGRARLQQGQIYGNLVAGISQVPAQIIEDRERQATIDLQRAQALATMRYAQNRDARETADQAYQDQTRAQELAKQVKVRAIIQAYTDGTPNDPSTNNLAAGVAKAKEVGLPEYIPNLWELHQKEQQLANPRPYETDPTKDLRDPRTNAIVTPGQPKMPEIGTDAYERAVAIRNLTGPAPGAPGAPALAPGAPAPTYAGRLDALQNGPPPAAPASSAAPPIVPPGGPAAGPSPALAAPPADVPAFDAAGTFTGPTTYGPAPASIAPPISTPPAAAAPPRPLTMAEATAKVYADQRAAAEAAKDPHSAIYKEWQDYTKQGGTLAFDAYMTMDANRKKPVVSLSGMNALYSDIDPKAVALAIQNGSLPPDIAQYGRVAQSAIASELAKSGFNLSQAQTDWKATTRHIATLNNAQQLRLNQSINALPELFDSVDALAAQWKGGRFPILNKANLALAKQGVYGSDVASVARQLDAQIADVTADLGVVYMGGNSPTDHGLELAGKALAGEWDEKVLHDMVKLGRSNVNVRRNSINNTGVAGASATNPYAAPPPAAAPPPPPPPPAGGRGATPGAAIVVVDPQGGSHTFATQAQADEFKRIAGIK